MDYRIEKQAKKFVIGIEMRTDNNEALTTMPRHWNKFFTENVLEKIPNKLNNTVFAVYTDYEGDYTMPYTYILGCEVSTLDVIPEGMTGKAIPEAKYAVFTSEGPYPQSLGAAWQAIWKTPLKRAYTDDFEVYPPDFNPQTNPAVKIYIAL